MARRTPNNSRGIPPVNVGRLIPASILYHLFRLENTLNTLHDVWQAKAHGITLDAERFRNASGSEIAVDSNLFSAALEQSSRICNEAISTIEEEAMTRKDNARMLAADSAIVKARNLLIGLDDLLRAETYRQSYPTEYASLQKELCRLADIPHWTDDDELVLTCLNKAAALVTKVLGSLQEVLDDQKGEA